MELKRRILNKKLNILNNNLHLHHLLIEVKLKYNHFLNKLEEKNQNRFWIDMDFIIQNII